MAPRPKRKPASSQELARRRQADIDRKKQVKESRSKPKSKREPAKTTFKPISLEKKGETVQGGEVDKVEPTTQAPSPTQPETIVLEEPEPTEDDVPSITSIAGVGAVLAGKNVRVGDRVISTGLGEQENVIAGTVPIGPATGAAIASGIAQQLSSKSKVASAVGKIATQTPKGSAATFATNTKTIKQTTTWITKLGKALRSPAVVAGGLVAAIGSYPFAGFIKEEALQTLSFGTRAAMENGDLENAQLALDQQKELLDPGLWDQMLQKIPFANTLNSLTDFYSAAATKVGIDERIIQDMRIQQETGESSDERWARIRTEEAEQDKASVDYYNEQRKLMVEWERDAERNARNEDAAFWRKEREAQSQKEKEDRQAISDFWQEYRKEMQKLSDDSRPSNLNFGLI